ncbi:hypothetical protein [Thiolinea disciformis]|uniref:hypothetical protein n=1 Tax=Thiolinea disciformis TaxID=125614 RepID=UPI0012FF1411|nr:hypothetical protein [Thiolinea disciformis]
MTEHSRNLRNETSKQRRKRILEDDGKLVQVLLEKDYAAKFNAIKAQIGHLEPATDTDTLKDMIDYSHRFLFKK